MRSKGYRWCRWIWPPRRCPQRPDSLPHSKSRTPLWLSYFTALIQTSRCFFLSLKSTGISPWCLRWRLPTARFVWNVRDRWQFWRNDSAFLEIWEPTDSFCRGVRHSRYQDALRRGSWWARVPSLWKCVPRWIPIRRIPCLPVHD